jgi:hypothetical protein
MYVLIVQCCYRAHPTSRETHKLRTMGTEIDVPSQIIPDSCWLYVLNYLMHILKNPQSVSQIHQYTLLDLDRLFGHLSAVHM